jgi:hypothetical protein
MCLYALVCAALFSRAARNCSTWPPASPPGSAFQPRVDATARVPLGSRGGLWAARRGVVCGSGARKVVGSYADSVARLPLLATAPAIFFSFSSFVPPLLALKILGIATAPPWIEFDSSFPGPRFRSPSRLPSFPPSQSYIFYVYSINGPCPNLSFQYWAVYAHSHWP